MDIVENSLSILNDSRNFLFSRESNSLVGKWLRIEEVNEETNLYSFSHDLVVSPQPLMFDDEYAMEEFAFRFSAPYAKKKFYKALKILASMKSVGRLYIKLKELKTWSWDFTPSYEFKFCLNGEKFPELSKW